jgi:hypothetical protein
MDRCVHCHRKTISSQEHVIPNLGGSLSFLVGTIGNVLVMEIGWTDVGSGGYIFVSCAHSNTSWYLSSLSS